jgi:hypothetical protein
MQSHGIRVFPTMTKGGVLHSPSSDLRANCEMGRSNSERCHSLHGRGVHGKYVDYLSERYMWG